MGFEHAVPPDGYRWWYIDALSDAGDRALTLIAFIGSVFSPYYAAARRHGAADPLNHCAVNVALYGRRGTLWAMTERGKSRVARDDRSLAIGGSAIVDTGDAVEITLDELAVPWCRRIRGVVRLTPRHWCGRGFELDGEGLHRWSPIAPSARVELRLDRPALAWDGEAYLDSNWGTEPLEGRFREWTWSRAHLPGRTVVLYDREEWSGATRSLALAIDPHGAIEEFAPPPKVALASTAWRLARRTRTDTGRPAAIRRTLEDGPFYSRSLIDTHLFGRPVLAMHESLSLSRFRSRAVQWLLPFRMPRSPR